MSNIKRLLEIPGISLSNGNSNMLSTYFFQESELHLDIIKIFSDSGFLDHSNTEVDSFLIKAINVLGEGFVLKIHTCCDKIDINAPNNQGQTALTTAVIRNYSSIIDIIINDKKFDPECSFLSISTK